MAANIVLGIGGGIAAYKMASVASGLVQNGYSVQVVLTRGAAQFVGNATFAALCGKPPVSDAYDTRFPLGAHIELADDADLLVIAPATARLLASFAHGLADDLLATLYLSCQCPVLVAPAMSSPMWKKPAVQRNLDTLRADGVHLVGPESGWLSCRKQGMGRMSEPDTLVSEITRILA